MNLIDPPSAMPGQPHEIQHADMLLLSPQQKVVLKELMPIVRIATNGSRSELPVLPRTHSLIVGPSGGGKSFLATAIGSYLGLPTMVINVSSWVVLSARNEPWTMSTICEWLCSCENGGILVLDEIDKIHSQNDWIGHVRLEIHDISSSILAGAKLPTPVEDSCWDIPAPKPAPTIPRHVLEKRLRERVMIIGCGAWQHVWHRNSRPIGFTSDSESCECPSRDDLMGALDPELRMRFRDEVCWLPPMRRNDYAKVATEIATRLSDPEIRRMWTSLTPMGIDRAVSQGLGMRVFEELMLKAMILTQESADRRTEQPMTGNSGSLSNEFR